VIINFSDILAKVLSSELKVIEKKIEFKHAFALDESQ